MTVPVPFMLRLGAAGRIAVAGNYRGISELQLRNEMWPTLTMGNGSRAMFRGLSKPGTRLNGMCFVDLTDSRIKIAL